MSTIRLQAVAVALLIPLLALVSGQVPDSWVEGPFNHDPERGVFSDEGLVPNTFYHPNRTGLVTVWDAASGNYVSYDQEQGVPLGSIVFSAPERDAETAVGRLLPGVPATRGGGKVVIIGGKAAPTTHLDPAGMRIQAQYGCGGCHVL